MNKKTALIGIILVGIIILIAVFGTSTDGRSPGMLAAQSGTGDCVELYINGVLVYPDVSCMPPEPTETAEPTETPEPTRTIAPLPPTAEPPTPTPEPTHDTTAWHSPADGHHHGSDITASSFYTLVMQYAGQEIAYPWLSSPIENGYPIAAGKHEGFTWLIEEDTGCDDFNLPDGANCIKAYAYQVHSLGTAEAVRTRFHSLSLAALVCGPGGSEPCGWMFTGGVVDYGVLHNHYKTDVCRLDNDPPGFVYPPNDTTPGGSNDSFAPPYMTGHRTTDRPLPNNPQLWQSQGPNTYIIDLWYPHDPNKIVRAAWASLDAWEYADGDTTLCASPAFDVAICPDGSCDMNHTLFKVQTIGLHDLPSERPFIGFTDIWGHVDDTCTETSFECVPLYIGEDVPQGFAAFGRPFRTTCQDFSPCLPDFDDGTPLIMPGCAE